MRVCVVGAGAVGGLIGARLTTGEQVPVQASDRPQDRGPHDLVVLAVKAPAPPTVAPAVAPLLGDDGVVLPAMNGVPWWFMPAGASRSARRVGRCRAGDRFPGGVATPMLDTLFGLARLGARVRGLHPEEPS